MHRRTFLLTSAAMCLSACAAPSGPVALAPDSTIYVIRHGDRHGSDLNAKGIARAEALVGALDGAPLDAIYSPGTQRNLDTAAPLAAARGLPVSQRQPEAPTRRLTREAAGRDVIWVGNKGNINKIWEDLRLPGPPPLEYGDLFVVRSDGTGRVSVERRFFGPANQ